MNWVGIDQSQRIIRCDNGILFVRKCPHLLEMHTKMCKSENTGCPGFTLKYFGKRQRKNEKILVIV